MCQPITSLDLPWWARAALWSRVKCDRSVGDREVTTRKEQNKY